MRIETSTSPGCLKYNLERCDSDFEDTIGNFIETLDIHRSSQPFSLWDEKEDDQGVTILEEEISECPFRVVTDYEKLTNSFWNFYLVSEQ